MLKSIIITVLMFLGILLAVRFDVFDALSSKYAYIIGFAFFAGALLWAYKVLGNPFDKGGQK